MENETQVRPERRQHPRVAAGIEVEVFGEHQLVPCNTVDVSLGGARVYARRGFAEGDTVLAVLSGEPGDVVVLAKVLASTAIIDEGMTEMRLMFKNLSATRRELLSRLLEVPS